MHEDANKYTYSQGVPVTYEKGLQYPIVPLQKSDHSAC